MSYEHKPNTGSLFKNDKRETEAQPNARGSALIEGVEYWVAAWTNVKGDTKYQSLKFSRKDENVAPKPAAPKEEDFDDFLPF